MSEYRLAMGPPRYLKGPMTNRNAQNNTRDGWRASLANGWTRCQHWHASAELAVDCLEDGIGRAFKP